MLCVHLNRHSERIADTTQDNRKLLLTNQNDLETQEGPRQVKSEDKYAAEEEIFMLPVEDVTLITSKLETKKGVQQEAKANIDYQYALSENCFDRCCASILRCCREDTKVAPFVSTNTTIFIGENPNRTTNFVEEHVPLPKEKKEPCDGCCNRFRCWCCRKRKLVDIIKRTNTVAERQAQRVVTVTIEYSKYSNLDSASNARLLSGEQQVAFYKEKFEPDIELKFYLITNTEIDSTNFNEKKKQAETLCRTVMQLKGMRNHYPSETELEKILDLSHQRTFGDIHEEPNL
jgi:hypothetical protein